MSARGRGIRFLALAAIWAGGACARGPAGSAALPPVPTIEVTSKDPAILEQVRAAREALAQGPEDAGNNGRMGELYELYQRPAAAEACYERAARLAPGELRWRYFLARIQHATGKSEAAVESLRAALALDARYLAAQGLLGDILLEQGRIDEAEAAFRAALSILPTSCSGLVGLGRVLAARGQHQEAVGMFLEALKVAPQHGPLHQAAGLSQRALGNLEVAQKHLDFAAKSGPANPDPDPLLQELIALEVGVNSEYRRAKDLMNAQRFEDALPILRRVVAADPEHVGALGVLAKCLWHTSRNEEALATYERAVALNPTNIDFLRGRAALLYNVQRFIEAEADLRKVLELGGNHADDHEVLAHVLVKLERPDLAEQELERALELQPDHPRARATLQALREFRAGR